MDQAPMDQALTAIISSLADGLAVLQGALAGSARQIAGSLTSSIAAFQTAVAGAVQQVAGAVTPFVAALSPATVQQFDWAMRSLQATVGAALLPALQVLTGVVNDIAGVIDPLMQALAPIIAEVTQAFGTVLLSALRALVTTLTALLPVFEVMAQVAQLLADVFEAVSIVVGAVVRTVAQFIAALLGGINVKDTMGLLTQVIHQVIRVFILLTAQIALLFGATGYIGNLIQGLNAAGEHKQGEVAAPQNASVKGLEQIVKDLAAASFVSMPGGDDKNKTDNEWLGKIATELQEMKGDSIGATIEGAVEKGFKNIWDTFQNWWNGRPAAPAPGKPHGAGVGGATGGVPNPS